MFVNKFWIQGLFGPYKDLPTGGQEGEISDKLPEQSPCQLTSDIDIHLGPTCSCNMAYTNGHIYLNDAHEIHRFS